MNAVEIEVEVGRLLERPFDRDEFPFQFLEAFGNKPTTLNRLRTKTHNPTDIPGAVLQRNHIHLLVCDPGQTAPALARLKASPATAKHKAKYVLATDGRYLEAEELATGEPVACELPRLIEHFGFFLPLAGITTVREIKDNPIDVRATSKLNRLYVELLKHNPDWATDARRSDMNHFMARLIFCFFAEDTNIFNGDGLFTQTIAQMSDPSGSNVPYVLESLFRAMNLRPKDPGRAALPPFADAFPYVNGHLFAGSVETPKFSKIARTYLLHAGDLNWQEINPDIFGSMIQAVAHEEERGELGMHFTSVPNIMKVLNPLFLDELRAQLEAAGENPRALDKLRDRLARIRVFDPACGSGNFLVIAYRELRRLEAEIDEKRGRRGAKSGLSLQNFRGIEIRDFPAEIARLALIIAEYQADVRHRGELEARAEFLPLANENWIIKGNALRMDWAEVCPPSGSAPARTVVRAGDLFQESVEQEVMGFENDGAEVYICGNPPYLGFTFQTPQHKKEMEEVFGHITKTWRSLDYVTAWFMKAALYGENNMSRAAFVTTNSICQGESVFNFWPMVLKTESKILFAFNSFKWANLAANNAGVTVSIIGIQRNSSGSCRLYSTDEKGEVEVRKVEHISPYLVPADVDIVYPAAAPTGHKGTMVYGNKPSDGRGLALTPSEKRRMIKENSETAEFIKRYAGSKEFIRGIDRYCLWVQDEDAARAASIPSIKNRFDIVTRYRLSDKAAPTTRPYAAFPHRFRQIQDVAEISSIVVPSVSSEERDYLPVGLLPADVIVSNAAFALYDAPLWNMALIASRLHLVWIATVCGKLKTDFRYSNTLGWNTFPVPNLITDEEKDEMTKSAERILLVRERHFPKTIADLYDPDKMPPDLRAAHDDNDELIERIYAGRRFKNDTDRLETLFAMYADMIAKRKSTPNGPPRGRKPAPRQELEIV